jgi:hypothetical protein
MCLVSSMLQLEEGSIDLYTKTVKEDGLTIDMEVAEKPRTIDAYVQVWHIRVWEHGFIGIFKGKDSHSRTKAFKDQRQTDLAVKRVVFRCELNSQLPLISSF